MSDNEYRDSYQISEQKKNSGCAKMLNYSFPLFRIGITQIRLHWSILIVLLMLYGWISKIYPETPRLSCLGWAALATLGIYAIVTIHEMSHVYAARLLGCSTRRVDLSLFGGTAYIEGEMRHPGHEAIIAIAGPLSNMLIMTAWLGIGYYLLPSILVFPMGLYFELSPHGIFSFVYSINLAIALFNLLPMLPLDGGRVLRSAWSYYRGARHGSMWASYVGRACGALIIIYGIYTLAMGRYWSFVLIGIGLSCFIYCVQLSRAIKEGYPVYRDFTGPDWAAIRLEKKLEQREADKKRLDALLDKVSRKGLGSLTVKERKFLKMAGKSAAGKLRKH